MNTVKRLALVALLLIGGNTMRAQNSNLLYGSTRIPQMNNVNPAFFPTDNKVYVSTFGVNFSLGLPIALSDVVQTNKQLTDPQTGRQRNYNYIDLNNLMTKLTENNQINLGLDQYLMGFGFRLLNNFFTFSTQLRMTANLGLPLDVLELINKGNANIETGEVRDVDIVNGNLLTSQAYIELALGYGIKLHNLTVGVRAKPLMGLYNLTTANTHVTMHTDNDLQRITADAYYQACLSLPIDVEYYEGLTLNNIGDELSKALQNGQIARPAVGLGVDLGAKYNWKMFEFSASILDLGCLKWKTVYSLHPSSGKNAEFVFEGIDVTSAVQNQAINFDTLATAFKEQLTTLSDAALEKGDAYSTGLHTKFNLAAFANFPTWPKTRAGIVINGTMTPRMLGGGKTRMMRKNITMVASVNLFNWLEVSLSNTIVSNGYKSRVLNPGVGINSMLGRSVQGFLLLDFGSLNPMQFRNLNFFMGTNLLFGNKTAKPSLLGQNITHHEL